MIDKKYNIIGDVHGHASKLKELLLKLGYIFQDDKITHPEKTKVIFVGDYIDRGLEEESSILLVKKMVDSDLAIALMGNHEYNAICYATPNENKTGYIRPHTKSNNAQHKAFLDEYPFGTPKHKEVIDWFKTLPIYFVDDGIRVIHASWITSEVEKIQPLLNNDNSITDELISKVESKGWVYKTMEALLKGIEYTLPNGMSWEDDNVPRRSTVRFNWFKEVEKVTYKNCALSIPSHVDLPDVLIENAHPIYNEDEVVFFGHYWMTGTPKIQTEKTACVDYSVAKKGMLVAYQWNGEKILLNENFVF